MQYAKEISSSRKSPIIGILDYNDTLHFYDAVANKILNELKAKHDYGMVISDDGLFCYTSCYGRFGISCYSIKNGREIWNRNDLVKNQNIELSSDGKSIYCEFDNRAFTVLDAETGETIDTIRHTKMIFESSYNPIQFHKRKENYHLLNTETQAWYNIEKETFAILDLTFGPDIVCLTESGKDLRFININTGIEIWRCQPKSGSHYIILHYSIIDKCYYGILLYYKNRKPNDLIVRFDPLLGHSRTVTSFKSNLNTMCIAPIMNALATSFGEIIELDTGKSKGKIPIFD